MHLELSLGLGLLEDRLELGGLHDVTLDLEFARHEELLGVGLALGEVGEVIVGEDEGDGGLLAEALGDLAGALEVEVPGSGLASLVLEGEGEDGTALLDGSLALVLRGVQDGVDGIESRGGGELGCEMVSSVSYRLVAMVKGRFAPQTGASQQGELKLTRGNRHCELWL